MSKSSLTAIILGILIALATYSMISYTMLQQTPIKTIETKKIAETEEKPEIAGATVTTTEKREQTTTISPPLVEKNELEILDVNYMLVTFIALVVASVIYIASRRISSP